MFYKSLIPSKTPLKQKINVQNIFTIKAIKVLNNYRIALYLFLASVHYLLLQNVKLVNNCFNNLRNFWTFLTFNTCIFLEEEINYYSVLKFHHSNFKMTVAKKWTNRNAVACSTDAS